MQTPPRLWPLTLKLDLDLTSRSRKLCEHACVCVCHCVCVKCHDLNQSFFNHPILFSTFLIFADKVENLEHVSRVWTMWGTNNPSSRTRANEREEILVSPEPTCIYCCHWSFSIGTTLFILWSSDAEVQETRNMGVDNRSWGEYTYIQNSEICMMWPSLRWNVVFSAKVYTCISKFEQKRTHWVDNSINDLSHFSITTWTMLLTRFILTFIMGL